ncbi:zinc ribbon domain-containing protein [Nitrosopumilus sp.]|nr:zinc ribbon domain-containing protein [Nitrosopumilus sp.]MDB4839990.1 zinc ribbon domain-containing protein [Nitrosopumilus sp.]
MQSLLDQVNILIKMKVGDPYRLEHIKLMLKQKRTVYGSDRAYLDHLIHDYIEQVKTQKKLSKIRGEDPFEEDSEIMVSEEGIEDDDEDDVVEMEHIYCWKCGKSIPVNSKFCLDCGSDVKNPEVKEDPVEKIPEKIPDEVIEKKSNNGSRKNILIVIGVLSILAVIGGIVVMNNGFDKTVSLDDDSVQPPTEIISETIESGIDINSKCGSGTVFDDATNTCLLEETQTSSKCGAGTVFDDATNTCLIP